MDGMHNLQFLVINSDHFGMSNKYYDIQGIVIEDPNYDGLIV